MDCENPAWMPGGVLVWFPTRFTDFAAPRRVTTDLNAYHGVAITADGNTLVTQRMLEVINLWIVREGKAQQLSSVRQGVAANGIRVLPDGGFVYHPDQSGRWDIWVRDAHGEHARRLTSEGGNSWPSPSPDGSEIAFESDRSGGLEIWKTSVSGDAPVRLTQAGLAFDAAWIGDEIFLRAKGPQPGTQVLYRMPARGGDAVQVTKRSAWNPKVSPDGTRLMYVAYDPEKAGNRVEIMLLATGEVEHVIKLGRRGMIVWSPDGSAIHYDRDVDGQDNVWSHPISAGDDTSGDVRITNFDDGLDILSFDWSQDGRTLALSRGKTYQDIVLLKGFR